MVCNNSFVAIAEDFQLLTIVAMPSILDVCGGPDYASAAQKNKVILSRIMLN